MDLLERYIQQVGRALPKRLRPDVEAELASLLAESHSERMAYAGELVAEEVAVGLLRELGPPEAMADSYLPVRRYLIGPRFFRAFITTLIMAMGLFVAVFGFAALELRGPAFVWSRLALAARALFLVFVQSGLSVFGAIVIIFAVAERLPARPQHETVWDPRDLPRLNDPRQVDSARIAVVLSLQSLALLALLFFPGVVGGHFVTIGEESGFVPLVGVGIERLLPWFGVCVALELTLGAVLLRSGRWTWWTLGTTVCLAAGWVVATVALWNGPPVTVDGAFLVSNGWSEAAAAQYQRAISPGVADRVRIVVAAAVSLIVLIRIYRVARFARRALAVSAGLAFLLAGAGGCAAQTTAEWESAPPGSVGLDSMMLQRLNGAAESGAFPNLHAILIAREGRLVFEKYYSGFEPENLQYTASVSKSVGSMLLGIAIEQGLVPGASADDVQVPVREILPEYADALADSAKRDLALHHVLTMTAGLEWDEQSFPYSDSRNDWIQASRSVDPVGFVLARPVVARPGSAFNYNGGLSITLAHLVERGAGMRADRFAERFLFAPLGITDYRWDRLANGMTDTDGGLHLRPLDMAKLGQLYLNGGVWRGARVVPEAWVRASVREHVVTEGQPNYGYQWWCGDFQFAGRSTFAFLASGHGGQKIYVFPDLELVVVITHAVFDNPAGELHNGAILARFVLPAAVDAAWEDPVALDSATLSRYAGDYISSSGDFRIVLREGALTALSEGSPPLLLAPLSATRFRGTLLDLIDVSLDFEVTADGTVKSVRTRFMFNDITYRKAAGGEIAPPERRNMAGPRRGDPPIRLGATRGGE